MENLDCHICLVGVRNAVLCPKCSKVFCCDCVSRLFEPLRPISSAICTNCPHCQAALLEKDFLKVNWLNDLRKEIAQIPESFVDKCRKHPQRQGSLHCVPCDRSICMECRKGDHRGTEHQVESVELLHEKIAEEWGNRKEDLQAIHGVIDAYREDEKKIEELLAEGEQRIDQITREMIKRLREEVLSVRNRHNAAYPQLNFFTQRSSPLVDSVKSAAEATILNRLVEQRPKLKELGSMIDETVGELRGANDKPQYAVLKIPDVLSILEPWTPNWVIDEIVDIPKREPGYPCGFSRHLTAVERGSLPPFVMKLVLTSGLDLYARLVTGPQKLSNIEFVIESVTPRSPGHEPAYRHAFVPRGDFAKSEFLNLHWSDDGLERKFRHCFVDADCLIAHFRIRVRPRDYSQIQRIKTKVDDDDVDEEGEGREMRQQSNNNDNNEDGDGATGYDPSSSNNNSNNNNNNNNNNTYNTDNNTDNNNTDNNTDNSNTDNNTDNNNTDNNNTDNNDTNNDTAKNNKTSNNTTENDDTDSDNNARSSSHADNGNDVGAVGMLHAGAWSIIAHYGKIKTEKMEAWQRIESQRRILRHSLNPYEEIYITDGGETVRRGDGATRFDPSLSNNNNQNNNNQNNNNQNNNNQNNNKSNSNTDSNNADNSNTTDNNNTDNDTANNYNTSNNTPDNDDTDSVNNARSTSHADNGNDVGCSNIANSGSDNDVDIKTEMDADGSRWRILRQSYVNSYEEIFIKDGGETVRRGANGSGSRTEIESGSRGVIENGSANDCGSGNEIENGSALGVQSGGVNGSGRGSDLGNGSGSGSGIVGECRVKPSNKRGNTGIDSVESDGRKKKKKHEGDA